MDVVLRNGAGEVRPYAARTLPGKGAQGQRLEIEYPALPGKRQFKVGRSVALCPDLRADDLRRQAQVLHDARAFPVQKLQAARVQAAISGLDSFPGLLVQVTESPI
jgi:hypothetical protein